MPIFGRDFDDEWKTEEFVDGRDYISAIRDCKRSILSIEVSRDTQLSDRRGKPEDRSLLADLQ